MKSAAYSDLLNLVFNGPDRDVVVRAMLDYLKQNRFQKENRLEWFLPVSANTVHLRRTSVGQTIVFCRLPTCTKLADHRMRWSAPQSEQYWAKAPPFPAKVRVLRGEPEKSAF